MNPISTSASDIDFRSTVREFVLQRIHVVYVVVVTNIYFNMV